MPHHIRAVTLDLDDTLWPIAPVIERAERILHEWCERNAPKFARALPPAEFALYRRTLARDEPGLAHEEDLEMRPAQSPATKKCQVPSGPIPSR